DEEGNRRLDNRGDFVRLEVQTAADRRVRVVPVLDDGASPPRQEQLTSELHKLAGLNAHKLSNDRYHYDADQLLDLIERVLRAQNEDWLKAQLEHAEAVGKAGDPTAARDLYAALIPIRERVSGAEHPDTLRARYRLAYWTGQAGDPAAARDQLAALLPVMERVLGPEDPDTAKAALEHRTFTNLARYGRLDLRAAPTIYPA